MACRFRPILLMSVLLTAAACDRQAGAPAMADNGADNAAAIDERQTLDAEVQALAAQARADAEANALAAQEDLAANLLANASLPPAEPEVADFALPTEAVPAPQPAPLSPARLAPPSADELKAAEASVAAAMEKRRARE